MAYRDPTFNANVLTDLLSTYLTHKSDEREKYYKAAEKANKTVIRQGADGYLYYLPESGEAGSRALPNVVKNEKKISSTIEEFFDKDNKSVLIKNVNGIRTDLDGNPIKSSDLKGLSKTKKQIAKKGQTSDVYKAVVKKATREKNRLLSIKNQDIDIYSGKRPGITWKSDPTHSDQLKFYDKVLSDPRKWIRENPDAKLPTFKKTVKEVKRIDPKNGRSMIFNAETKEFIRYEDE
tara:strand:+ start:6432 stop:7136 length:705 start_codon:yes stop_codon:yes gene_type:complete